MSPTPTEAKRRKRLALTVIAALFVVPVVGSYVLFLSGWKPSHTRNHGELLTPARDISGHPIRLADGAALAWKDPELDHWTLLAVPGPACASHCLERLDELRRARLTLNQNAPRLRLVVLDTTLAPDRLAALAPMVAGSDPDAVFAELRPGPDDVAAALVDPSGFYALRYKAGYDGTGLRKDLSRLIRSQH